MKTQLSTHLPEIRIECSKYLPIASMVFNVDGWGCLGMATKTIVTNAAKYYSCVKQIFEYGHFLKT